MSTSKRSGVRVAAVEEHPQPEQVRRIGRALIELARIQLAAEEAAEDRPSQPRPPTSPSTGGTT